MTDTLGMRASKIFSVTYEKLHWLPHSGLAVTYAGAPTLVRLAGKHKPHEIALDTISKYRSFDEACDRLEGDMCAAFHMQMRRRGKRNLERLRFACCRRDNGSALCARREPRARDWGDMIGTLTHFNDERGFGFNAPDDGTRDVFVHATDQRPSSRGASWLKKRSSHSSSPHGLLRRVPVFGSNSGLPQG